MPAFSTGASLRKALPAGMRLRTPVHEGDANQLKNDRKRCAPAAIAIAVKALKKGINKFIEGANSVCSGEPGEQCKCFEE